MNTNEDTAIDISFASEASKLYFGQFDIRFQLRAAVGWPYTGDLSKVCFCAPKDNSPSFTNVHSW